MATYDAMLKKVLMHKHTEADIIGGVTHALSVTACTNVRCITQGTTVRIKWGDPDDLDIDGVTVATWHHTVLRRKAGAYPASIADGTEIVSSSTRNQYNASAYTDTLPEDENTYYYRLFPVTDKGVVNLDDANKFIASGITWAAVADIVRGGEAAQYFSAGDVLTVQHSTLGEIEFEVAGIDLATPADSSKTHSMTLLSRKTLTGLPFDAPEDGYALTADTVFHPEYMLAVNIKGAATATTFAVEDKTATGTARVWYSLSGAYKLFYHAERWEVWSCAAGTHLVSAIQDYQSTVDAEPTGGTWNAATVAANANTYYTFDGTEYTAATVTAGAAVTASTYYEKNPHENRVSYGYNNWQESALRQWLNSSAAAGAWWSKQNIWDKQPAYAASMAGFLAGITDAGFLAAIGNVNVTTARNCVCDCGGSSITSDKVFLASNMEVYGSALNGIDEGQLFTIYNGVENTDRIKYNSANAAQYWWLRSPNVGTSHTVYYVTPTGSLNLYIANLTLGVAPACVIC